MKFICIEDTYVNMDNINSIEVSYVVKDTNKPDKQNYQTSYTLVYTDNRTYKYIYSKIFFDSKEEAIKNGHHVISHAIPTMGFMSL